MVGSGTVIKDDPELTVRLVENPDQRQPTRFIIDSTLRSSVNAKVFDQSLAKTVLVTTDQADKDKKDQLDGNGVEIWNIRTQTDGKIDLKELLRVMGLHEYCNLLVEGGSRLGTSMLKAGLIDKLCLFFTPNIIGGDGLSSIAELGLTDMSEAYKIKDLKCRQVGCDILMEAYPENK
jgi:diaminohydroxyphosphoribosylaminopyrimidine deaminase/5-amino-6-(5-phosphoribosylamino)uracil reductase